VTVGEFKFDGQYFFEWLNVRSMQGSLFLILALAIMLTAQHCPAATPEEDADKLHKVMQPVVCATIAMVKNVVLKQWTPEDLKNFENKATQAGIKSGYSYHYSRTKMGWMAKSSTGQEVIYVSLSLENSYAKEGEYLGIVGRFEEIQKIHPIYVQILSTQFTHVGSDVYDIGDNCSAKISLFKGNTGLGRTVITIKRT